MGKEELAMREWAERNISFRRKEETFHAINWISGLAAKKNIKEQMVGMTQSRGYGSRWSEGSDAHSSFYCYHSVIGVAHVNFYDPGVMEIFNFPQFGLAWKFLNFDPSPSERGMAHSNPIRKFTTYSLSILLDVWQDLWGIWLRLWWTARTSGLSSEYVELAFFGEVFQFRRIQFPNPTRI